MRVTPSQPKKKQNNSTCTCLTGLAAPWVGRGGRKVKSPDSAIGPAATAAGDGWPKGPGNIDYGIWYYSNISLLPAMCDELPILRDFENRLRIKQFCLETCICWTVDNIEKSSKYRIIEQLLTLDRHRVSRAAIGAVHSASCRWGRHRVGGPGLTGNGQAGTWN